MWVKNASDCSLIVERQKGVVTRNWLEEYVWEKRVSDGMIKLEQVQKEKENIMNNSKKCPVYFYAVVYFPKTKKDAEEEAKPELLTPPTQVVAGSEDEVKAIAIRGLAEEYMSKLSQIEVYIRPF